MGISPGILNYGLMLNKKKITLRYLNPIFNNLRQVLEFFYVAGGLKQVARVLLPEDQLRNFHDIKRLLEHFNIQAELSSLKYVAASDRYSGLFHAYFSPIPYHDPRKGMVYMYIAKSKKLAILGRYYEERKRDELFTELLGYPQCCIKFYNAHIEQCVRENTDLVFKSLSNTHGRFPFPFLNNYAARYFDVSLLSHYPCNFNCKASKRKALERLNFIRSLSAELADYIANNLKTAVLLTNKKGIYKIDSFCLSRDMLFIKPKAIQSFKNAPLLNKLKNCTAVKINAKNDFMFIRQKKVVFHEQGGSSGIFVFQ